jgi:hypothetical protein
VKDSRKTTDGWIFGGGLARPPRVWTSGTATPSLGPSSA